MKFSQYIILCDHRFPDHMLMHMMDSPAFNIPSLLRMMAVALFLESEFDSELANITRINLNSLEADGVHCLL